MLAVPTLVKVWGLGASPIADVLVQIHVDAYMFTLSEHVPGSLLAMHLTSKPDSWNRVVYHGLLAALRKSTRPLGLSTLFSAMT